MVGIIGIRDVNVVLIWWQSTATGVLKRFKNVQ
jgi:hypothetical protein